MFEKILSIFGKVDIKHKNSKNCEFFITNNNN